MKRKIATICGSSRFEKEIKQVNIELTKQGYTVLSFVCFNRNITDEQEKEFDSNLKDGLIESHFHKILLSNLVYIVDVNNYIGKHTQAEIDFAIERKIPIKYWSEEIDE